MQTSANLPAPGAVWYDGELIPSDDPRLPVWSHGVSVCDGVYETLRTCRDLPHSLFLAGARFEEHMERLANGCRFLHLALAPGAAAACREVIGANGLDGQDARVRIIVWRRGTSGVADAPDPSHLCCYAIGLDQVALDQRRTRGLRVVTLPPSRVVGDVLHNHKHMNAVPAFLARLRCAREGVDDALYTNSRGEICEAVWSNLFVLAADGVTLLTPPLDSPCLPGVTRSRVMRLAPDFGCAIRESQITVESIMSAREVFTTSSVSEVMPITHLNGMAIGLGTPGPVAARVQAAWRNWYTDSRAE